MRPDNESEKTFKGKRIVKRRTITHNKTKHRLCFIFKSDNIMGK